MGLMQARSANFAIVFTSLFANVVSDNFVVNSFDGLEGALQSDGADIQLIEDIMGDRPLVVPSGVTVRLWGASMKGIIGSGETGSGRLMEVHGTLDMQYISFFGGVSDVATSLPCGGGAILISATGSVSARGCIFEGNSATCGPGGAVRSFGVFNPTFCDFRRNFAVDLYGGTEAWRGQAVVCEEGCEMYSLDNLWASNGCEACVGVAVLDLSTTAAVSCRKRVGHAYDYDYSANIGL